MTTGHDALISELLKTYEANGSRVGLFRDQVIAAIEGDPKLDQYVHSVKSRVKDPGHLRSKLQRKADEAATKGTEFSITPENLLTRVTDLAGIRILHLHTRQIEHIDQALREIFDEQRYELKEVFARTWDDESRAFFNSCGIQTQESPTLYTSVHYVIGSASRTELTCEIQVRTLMEEVWGEVDHSLNYPVATPVLACREQLAVLARVTSSASRLVDAIFKTYADATEERDG